MNRLEEISNQFGVSKPVFKASLIYDDTIVEFTVKDRYKPDSTQYNDPIAKLIATRYQETLRTSERRFVQCTHLPDAYNEIVRSILRFYVNHAPLKNPKQSKLYKWLNSMANQYNHPASEGFIALYRYINKPMFGAIPDEKTNALSIIELMKDKYENTN